MSRQNIFRFRPFVSTLTGFSFVMIVLTGIVLFITPQGRIANWTNWTFWNLSKHQWISVHITFSALFLLTCFIHSWLNVRPLMNYFFSKTVRKPHYEWILAIILCVIVLWGSLEPFAPFSSILELRDTIKFRQNTAQQQEPMVESARNGNNEGGFGQKSLRQVCGEMEIDLQAALDALKSENIEISPDQRIRSIANENNLRPGDIRKILNQLQ